MDGIYKLDNVTTFNAERGHPTLHPLVSVLDQSKSKPFHPKKFISGLYLIFLKNARCADIKYGRNHYDYQEDSLLFIAPGQVIGFEEEEEELIQPNGWALAFHPDLIHGTHLGRHIKEYSFFSYDAREALHTSQRERQIVIESFLKISYELEQATDKHSRTLIANNIELLFNYCTRFYDRQFITRDYQNKDFLSRFEKILDDYFSSDKPQTSGIPSVAFCAAQLTLSANYLGDLIKRETGRSAQDYIQEKTIAIAKERVFDLDKSISEIAYELGFKYPAHFTRFFKQKVGQSPNEYRQMN